jgi:hypothetical protein
LPVEHIGWLRTGAKVAAERPISARRSARARGGWATEPAEGAAKADVAEGFRVSAERATITLSEVAQQVHTLHFSCVPLFSHIVIDRRCLGGRLQMGGCIKRKELESTAQRFGVRLQSRAPFVGRFTSNTLMCCRFLPGLWADMSASNDFRQDERAIIFSVTVYHLGEVNLVQQSFFADVGIHMSWCESVMSMPFCQCL